MIHAQHFPSERLYKLGRFKVEEERVISRYSFLFLPYLPIHHPYYPQELLLHLIWSLNPSPQKFVL
jgi:hypothetical protein